MFWNIFAKKTVASGFNPGGIRDIPDVRDWQWSEVGYASEPFSWNEGYDIERELGQKLLTVNFKLPVKDQNGSYSCGGQAWAYYDSVFEAMATGTFEERSARYIYSQTWVAPNGGSTGRDNSDILTKQGVAREAIFTSYNNGVPPTESFMRNRADMTEAVMNDASKAKAKGYANVPANIDSIAQAIRDNYGVVIGVDGQNNGTWSSAFPKPPSYREWGHWLYCGKARFINGKKYIGVLNSWGESTGESGWQWLGEEYFTSGHVWNGWTQVFDPASAPDFAYTFTKQMSLGATGEEVKALQTALKIEGVYPEAAPVSGYFGAITQDAVKKFQKKWGIASWGTPSTTGYGRVGAKTISRLNILFS